MSSAHADKVRRLAEAIELSASLKEEVACLSLHLGETPNNILVEAMSELRSLYNVLCNNLDHSTTACCAPSVEGASLSQFVASADS